MCIFSNVSWGKTVHKLFGLFIKSKIGDLDERKLKLLTEKFKKGLCLLIIDEFNMESRAMMGLIIDRLRSIHIDFDKINVIFIGDPAQLLPIGGEPCWSIKLKRNNFQEFNDFELSLAIRRTKFLTNYQA